jgi:hypothetical protein
MLPFNTLLNNIITYILEPVVLLMFVWALVVFLFGVYKFIKSTNSGDADDDGKRNLLWGVVGMLIMVSVYGIIQFILNSIDVELPENLQF